LDHDDVLLQNTLLYLANYMENESCEIVCGDYVNSDSNLEYNIGRDYCGRSFLDTRSALFSVFTGKHYFQHTFMISMNLWRQVGGYDEALTFGEDFDICVRCILAGHIPRHYPITTFVRRNHGRNLTTCYQSGQAVWLAEVRSHFRKFRQNLYSHLTTKDISFIEEVLKIFPGMALNSPPTMEDAIALTATRKPPALAFARTLRHAL